MKLLDCIEKGTVYLFPFSGLEAVLEDENGVEVHLYSDVFLVESGVLVSYKEREVGGLPNADADFVRQELRMRYGYEESVKQSRTNERSLAILESKEGDFLIGYPFGLELESLTANLTLSPNETSYQLALFSCESNSGAIKITRKITNE